MILPTYKVYSAQKLTPIEVQKIRYLLKTARNRETALHNMFPTRYKRREGNMLFFDVGKRRYCETINTKQDDKGECNV